MVLVFDDELTCESVSQLIRDVDGYINEGRENIVLYFTTIGGDVVATETLLTYLNEFCVGKVKIIFTFKVYSGGAWILLHYRGDRFLSKNLEVILIHIADRQSYQRRITDLDRAFSVASSLAFEEEIANYQQVFNFTKSELKKLKNGEDLIFSPKDFQRFNIPFYI